MHSGTKFCQNPVKIQWSVASTFSRTPFRSHLVTSFAPERSMQKCLSHNVPVCPAMCLPASKFLCLPRNCKDMGLLLALQLATSEGNNVFNRGSSRQSSHKVIHTSHRSQIAAASQPHRRKTYRQEMTRAWLARLLQIRASRDSCLRKQTQRKTAIMVPQEASPHSYGAIGASESNFLRYRANFKK